MTDDRADTILLEMTADITVAWLSNKANRVANQDLPVVLRAVHAALSSITDEPTAYVERAPDFIPTVSVRRSLASRDHIISMIDGKPYRTLKRHLGTHGLSPEEYRDRYNLKPNYPMIAPNYAAMRSELAKKIGLGQKGRAAKRAAPKPVRQSRAKKA